MNSGWTLCTSSASLGVFSNSVLLHSHPSSADADQERMSRLRRSMPSVPNALGKLHKNPKAHKIGESACETIYTHTISIILY